MVSYVDVLTILLIFFLVAAAKSLEVQHAPPAAVPAQPAVPMQTIKPGPMTPHPTLILAQQRFRARGLEAKLEPRGLVINLPQSILFPEGGDIVTNDALPALAQIAIVLRDIPNPVRLIGHADMTPIHTRRFASNWDLSMARSHKLLELLSTRYGIPESRLSITSYGPYRPAAPNDTADGRALNRRVEILILDGDSGDGN